MQATIDVATEAPREDPTELGVLLTRAIGGDRNAWEEIVDRHNSLVWYIVRSYHLSDADSADAVQTAWLRFLENATRIRDPERIGTWLATTTRRECVRLSVAAQRVVPTAGTFGEFDVLEGEDVAVNRLIAEEERAAVHEALEQLPPRWRRVITLLMEEPDAPYALLAEELGVPVGSIGPTRGR